MDRGFACVSLDTPKFPQNIGEVLRACHCHKVAQLNIANGNRKGLTHKTNTPMAHRHTPTFFVGSVMDYLPVGVKTVVVELVDNAIPLPEFNHPDRAVYIFGPENGSISQSTIDAADFVVQIPTRDCMNLAATVNVVLYDRMCKGREFGDVYKSVVDEKLYTRKPH